MSPTAPPRRRPQGTPAALEERTGSGRGGILVGMVPDPVPAPPPAASRPWLPWVLVIGTLLVLNYCWLSFL